MKKEKPRSSTEPEIIRKAQYKIFVLATMIAQIIEWILVTECGKTVGLFGVLITIVAAVLFSKK